jgi:hypothetical protein
VSTFAELKAAVLARGFNRLTDTQRGEYVNAAVTEIDGLYPWPYRLTTTTGAAPLAVSTLGEVDTVTDTVQDVALEPAPFQLLTDWFGDVTTTGSPSYFYVDWAAGAQTVRVFPVSTNNLSVRHYAIPTALSAAGDTPAAPTRFHLSVYVPVACRMAAADSGGDPSRFDGEAQRGLQTMMLALLPDQLSGMVQRVDFGSAADW